VICLEITSLAAANSALHSKQVCKKRGKNRKTENNRGKGGKAAQTQGLSLFMQSSRAKNSPNRGHTIQKQNNAKKTRIQRRCEWAWHLSAI